jgi:hypothetical protein
VTPDRLLGQIDQLLSYFNRRVMDVPDRFFDRDAQFLLNGVPYEHLLGRDATDALVRLIARGPAGYRFAAKAVQHALETVLVTREAFEIAPARATGHIILRGTLRGSAEVFEERLPVDLTLTPAGAVAAADIRITDAALATLIVARAHKIA